MRWIPLIGVGLTMDAKIDFYVFRALQGTSRLGPAGSKAKGIGLSRRGICSAITTSSTLLPETTCAAHTRGSSGKIDFLLSDQIIHSSVHVSLLFWLPTWVGGGSRKGR